MLKKIFILLCLSFVETLADCSDSCGGEITNLKKENRMRFLTELVSVSNRLEKIKVLDHLFKIKYI